MNEWVEIRRLHHSEGLGIKTIVRRLGVTRNNVRAALAPDTRLRCERAPAGSIVDAYVPPDPGTVDRVPEGSGHCD